MPNVYVVQEPLRIGEGGVPVPRINYGTLTPYGTVKFLFSWGEITDDTRLDFEAMRAYMARAREALKDFSDDDYLVPMGHPALIAIATLAAADVNGRLNILDWSRERRAYRVVQLDCDD